ncbi:hypothetical protein BOX15_Mlig004706g1 [Macrostomum lignano]|uniref:RING-type domain-containing protein n=2 Tax=Macrostomum lignano TaxID=282301 RepID=A0A1I8I8B9_9PLAT|nr:hypothetical protein BOX15_Mlig004706g3 [Macrostomum lignano]PAA62228.1 hypothetical protein BOX15_Mlig004706g2 [Macrostomum lignano]PAA64434.1 hypothetical protein BOX15_Mlig004706g1 [Macrostomum lignano]
MGNCLRNCLSTDQVRPNSGSDFFPDSRNQASSESGIVINPIVDQLQRGTRRSSHNSDGVQDPAPLYYLAPGVGRRVDQLSEEEQVRIAKRMGLIGHLPIRHYSCEEDDKDNNPECVICMVEYAEGDPLRCLPCGHGYHRACIDDWLMRSCACPSCNRPADPALLNTFSPQSTDR